jgi:hypothetical protein
MTRWNVGEGGRGGSDAGRGDDVDGGLDESADDIPSGTLPRCGAIGRKRGPC